MPGRARTSAVVAIVGAILLGTATAAHAAPPPEGLVPPIKCLSEFLNNDDYSTEGWVKARVAEVELTEGNTKRTLFIGCGDERSGVVHIASSRSNGTVHPIYASTQGAFVQCFARLARNGSISPDKEFPGTRDRYELTFVEPGEVIEARASMVVDRAGGFVWAMQTTTTPTSPKGNNWAGCSGQTAVA